MAYTRQEKGFNLLYTLTKNSHFNKTRTNLHTEIKPFTHNKLSNILIAMLCYLQFVAKYFTKR